MAPYLRPLFRSACGVRKTPVAVEAELPHRLKLALTPFHIDT